MEDNLIIENRTKKELGEGFQVDDVGYICKYRMEHDAHRETEPQASTQKGPPIPTLHALHSYLVS
eukprot:m.81904 g.81904  ORF g.81904 m.81904 type:complete len:65 (+) comp12658_c0_seq1:232-426(+)